MIFVNWDTRVILSGNAFDLLVDKEAEKYIKDRNRLKDYVASTMDFDEFVDAVADDHWEDILEGFEEDCGNEAYGVLREIYEGVVPLDELPIELMPSAE